MKKILAVLALLLLPIGASAYEPGDMVQIKGACDSPDSMVRMVKAIDKDDDVTTTALMEQGKCFRLAVSMVIAMEPVSNPFEVGAYLWRVWKGTNPLIKELYFLENLPRVKL